MQARQIAVLDALVFGFCWVYLATLTTLLFGLVGLLSPTPVFVFSLVGLVGVGVAWRRGGLSLTAPWAAISRSAATSSPSNSASASFTSSGRGEGGHDGVRQPN